MAKPVLLCIRVFADIGSWHVRISRGTYGVSIMAGMEKDELFRSGGRAASQARALRLTPGFVATAEGSVLIEVGHTRVLCNATVQEGVPGGMRNSGRGG